MERRKADPAGDMLERLRIVLDLNLNDVTEIPRGQRDILKRHLVTAFWEDCQDMGIGVEAGLMISNYYTKKE